MRERQHKFSVGQGVEARMRPSFTLSGSATGGIGCSIETGSEAGKVFLGVSSSNV